MVAANGVCGVGPREKRHALKINIKCRACKIYCRSINFDGQSQDTQNKMKKKPTENNDEVQSEWHFVLNVSAEQCAVVRMFATTLCCPLAITMPLPGKGRCI